MRLDGASGADPPPAPIYSCFDMDIGSERQELLAEVLRRFIKESRWPNEHAFKMERLPQRALINETAKTAALNAGGETLELTLSGLFELESPEADAELQYAGSLWSALHEAYKERPNQPVTVDELAGIRSRLGEDADKARIARALTFLQYLHTPRWMTVNRATPERLVQQIHILEAVLDLDANNWKQKFADQQSAERRAAEPGAASRPAPTIFISFSHNDEQLAALLTKAVEAAGLTPFLSSDGKRGLPGGEGWFAELIAKIRSSAGLIFLATPSSVNEDWPTFEVGGVYCAGHRALSVCVGVTPADLPKPLQQIQAVSVGESDEKVMHRIADALGKPLEQFWKQSWEEFRAFLEPAREANRRGKAVPPAMNDPAYRAWKRKMLFEIFTKGSPEGGWKTVEHAVDHNESWELLADKELLFHTFKNVNRFEITATDSLLARSDRLKTTDPEALLASIDEKALVEDEPLE